MFGFPQQQPYRSRRRGIPRLLVSTLLVASSFAVITAVDIAPSLAAPPVGMFTQISAGYSHTCAVDSEGSIWCWGSDSSGQLGNGATTGDQASPVEVTGGRIYTRVTAGKDFTCALEADGDAACWGENSSGQLGDNGAPSDANAPVSVAMPGVAFVDIAAGDSHACALSADGDIYCWGEDGDEQLGDGAGATDQDAPGFVDQFATSVTASAKNGCAMFLGGAAGCWGDDASGQLGNGLTTGTKDAPVSVEMPAGKRFTSIASSATHACALASDGTAYCWGSDGTGQLGNGTGITSTLSAPSAVTMPTGKFFTRIDGGTGHTCALASDGAAWCWGDDASGQIGNSTTTGTQAAPVAVSMPSAKRFTAVSTGAEHTCALSTEGLAYCWGSDTNGRLGNGATLTANQVIPSVVAMPATSAGWTSVSAGGAHTCAVASDGTGWCWGSDADDQIGNGTVSVTQFSPATVSMPSARLFTQITAGSNFSCALSSYGTAYCWGRGNSGQLGNGGYYPQKSPYAVRMPSGKTFTQISAGTLNACALTADGLAYCWGPDTSGQIGNGSTTGIMYAPSPVTMPTGKRFVRITVGGAHACAIADDGTVYCWGSDASGQLGNGAGTTANQTTPSAHVLSPQRDISAGSSHTCGVAIAHLGVCWGSDSEGQLGNGAITTGDQPGSTTLASPPSFFAQRVASGGSHGCALADGGSVYCWGDDASGQVGDDATAADQVTPVAIAAGGEPYLDLEAGTSHSCAIAADRSIWCWGSDATGQLGDGGSATDAFEPVDAGLPYPAVTLTVNLEGGGTILSGDTPKTIACPTDCDETYVYGTKVTLSAVSVSAQWPFIGWTGGVCGGTSTCSVTMTSDVTVTARFGALLTLTKNAAAAAVVATTAGSPAFTCGTGCARTENLFPLGTYVSLLATPETGYSLQGWVGCDSISYDGKTCNVRMSVSRTVTANFQARLTLTKNFAARATIASNPAGIKCSTSCTSASFNFPAGSTVTLTATLASGYTQIAWTGCTPTANPKVCTLVIGAAPSVTADITP